MGNTIYVSIQRFLEDLVTEINKTPTSERRDILTDGQIALMDLERKLLQNAGESIAKGELK